MSLRGRRVVALALGALLLLWWVAWFAYWPRPRTGRPDAATVCGQVLEDERLALRLWLPHPHQNLGVLARSLEAPESVVSAAWRLAGGSRRGRELDRLPGFGPLRYPPASEGVLAFDSENERFVLVWRVHAGFAVLGRVAGWLAGNPWLVGGEGDLAGRTVRIEWRGRNFIVRSADFELATGKSTARRWPRGYAAIGLAHPPRPWRPGRLVLRAAPGERGLDLVPWEGETNTDGSAADAPGPRPRTEPEVALLVWKGAGEADRPARGGLLVAVPEVRDGEVRLPSAAALSRFAEHRFRLPGEALARSLGLDLHRGRSGDFELVAIDSASAGLAQAWSADLASAPALPLWLWLRPRPLLVTAQRLRRALEAVPLLPEREVQRWRDAETLLRPLAALGTVELTVLGDGTTRVRWRREVES